jgi:hypothetical protein
MAIHPAMKTTTNENRSKTAGIAESYHSEAERLSANILNKIGFLDHTGIRKVARVTGL